jgi:hypothetical protein
MISRTEIKRQGWKPIQDHFTMKRHGRNMKLEVDNEKEEVTISEVEPMPEPSKANLDLCVFKGHIPKRYELQIVMRCLKLA